MIREILDNVQDTFLNSYGWHIEEADETEYDQPIYPGEFVYFWDDHSEKWSFGIYLGLYEDMNKSGDVSPYFEEDYNGIERIVIEDAVINPDDTVTLRKNYILPENTYGAYEPNAKVFNFLAA